MFSDVLALFMNLRGAAAMLPIGKTKGHFKVRMSEHFRLSVLTGERLKGDNNSAIKERHL